MQHANLQVALAADIADEFPKGQPLTLSGSRSPRTEMALRELANLARAALFFGSARSFKASCAAAVGIAKEA